MSKHTPGPWNYMERRFKGTYAVYAAGDELVYTAMVGDFSLLGKNIPNEANAKLISAAPDLFKALKSLKRGECFCDMAIGNPMVKMHADSCVIAMEAIKKAELERS